jgi:gas vesicle protein
MSSVSTLIAAPTTSKSLRGKVASVFKSRQQSSSETSYVKLVDGKCTFTPATQDNALNTAPCSGAQPTSVSPDTRAAFSEPKRVHKTQEQKIKLANQFMSHSAGGMLTR